MIVVNLNENCANVTFGNDVWFSPPYWFPGQFDPQIFEGYPSCSFDGTAYYGKNFTRPLDAELSLGPYNHERYSGYITPPMLAQMAACNVNYPSMAVLTTDLMEGYVWTYDVDQPSSTQEGQNCIFLNSSGRWATTFCDAPQYGACQSDSDSTVWKLSSMKTSWNDVSCDSGYSFAVPVNGYLNSLLMSQINQSEVWLNILAE